MQACEWARDLHVGGDTLKRDMLNLPTSWPVQSIDGTLFAKLPLGYAHTQVANLREIVCSHGPRRRAERCLPFLKGVGFGGVERLVVVAEFARERHELFGRNCGVARQRT